jgi:hypothetical protein
MSLLRKKFEDISKSAREGIPSRRFIPPSMMALLRCVSGAGRSEARYSFKKGGVSEER